MDNGISLADIRAVTEGENGFGDNGAWWILVLLLALGGNGFGFNGAREQYATQTDMQNGFNQQATTSKLDQLALGLADLGYENAQLSNNVINNLSQGFMNISQQMSNCCCDLRQEGLINRYEAEKNASALQNLIHAEGEATRNLIQENKIDALQGKVQALELQAALCGVVRYPNATVYAAGCNPYMNCGCSGTSF